MTKAICKRYITVFIVTLLSVGILSYILQTYFQINLGSAGSIVSVIVPAMDAGTNYYRKSGEIPASSIKWAFARYFTAMQVVFIALILAIVWNTIPEFSVLMSSVGLLILAMFIAFYLLIIFLVSRYFFGFGIKTAARSQAR